MTRKKLLKLGACILIGGWILFFLVYTKDTLPELPSWVRILAVVVVLGISVASLTLTSVKIDNIDREDAGGQKK